MTADLAPLLNTVVVRVAKATVADTGPPWLEAWTFPLAFGARGILGEDFRKSVTESKRAVGSFPSPGGGLVNGHQKACQQCPVQACAQRPGSTDSGRCLKLDSD